MGSCGIGVEMGPLGALGPTSTPKLRLGSKLEHCFSAGRVDANLLAEILGGQNIVTQRPVDQPADQVAQTTIGNGPLIALSSSRAP